jgi:hypothetical protein
LESEIDGLQPQKALRQQTGTNQQHSRKGEFGGGKTVAKTRAHGARRARRLHQHLAQVGLRRVPGRRNAK